MLDYKRWVVAGNYYASFATRWWRNRQAAAQGRAPVMVLFYHRVADEFPNDWTIGCDLFARQMHWIRKRYEIISLADACQRMRQAANSRPAVCITFDDGYADNSRFALPFLVREQIPCTYFVASEHIRSGRPFPHDIQSGRPLAPHSVDDLAQWAERGIEVGAHTRHHVDLGRVTDERSLRDEICGSRDDLAQITGRPVRFFAFPYGQIQNMSPLAFQVARQAGYWAVCSAYGGYNWPGSDPFHFQRIHGDPEMVRFRNWLTVDPRKNAMHPPLPWNASNAQESPRANRLSG